MILSKYSHATFFAGDDDAGFGNASQTGRNPDANTVQSARRHEGQMSATITDVRCCCERWAYSIDCDMPSGREMLLEM